jgi:hypothetical protein
MFYRALGFVVWRLALKYLRQRYAGYKRPMAALTVVAAIAAIYVATRDDE